MRTSLVIFCIILSCSNVLSQSPVDSLDASPNPFIKRTNLHYYLNNTDTASLFVYDVKGAIAVAVFTNTVKVTGGHNDSLLMDNFPDGVYFAVLKPVHSKSITRKLIKSGTASLGEINENNAIGLYPNPVRGLLTVDISDLTNDSWIILANALGQIVCRLEVRARVDQIDMTSLGAGIYYLSIGNIGKQYFSKIVKE